MVETANLKLPLLEAAQAQKHVTVNEALARLDALSQLVVQSDAIGLPPVGVADGLVWQVPEGAVNAWEGADGQLAIAANGGWVFVDPQLGWRAWLVNEGHWAVYDGSAWRVPPISEGVSGAYTAFDLIEFDHVIVAGAGHSTAGMLPAQSMVLGVTLRVTGGIAGSLASFKVGVAGAEDRYGTGYGTALNSWGRGLTGTPIAYYANTPLLLTPTGGNFGGGSVRFAIHALRLGLPVAV